MKRQASCVCGDLSAICSGEPAVVSLCHCVACQKRTGTPFGIAAFFKRDAVAVSGNYRGYTRSSDAGYHITFHFCPTCGATVWSEPERMPKLIAVAFGAFGDPTFPKPTQEVHTGIRHAWVPPLDHD